MQHEPFVIELGRLVASKLEKMDEMGIDVYWKNLGQLPIIEDVLKQAQKKTYYRGMPSVSELIDDHSNLVGRTNQQKAPEVLSYEPALTMGTRRTSKAADQFFFVTDCLKFFGIDIVWLEGEVDERKVEVPENYSKIRNKSGIDGILKLSLGDALANSPKVKKGLFTNLDFG